LSEELAMLESELFTFLGRTADAVFVLSDQGEIQFWNKAAERLFGYPAEEVRGKTCYRVLQGIGALGTRVCHEGCSLMECAGKQSEIPSFDMSVKTRSGPRIWINMSTIVFDNTRTGHRLLVHLARDISDQKKTELLLHKVLDLTQQLNQLGEPAERVSPVTDLSEQEKHVLQLFAEGKTQVNVAKSLDISSQTLRNHLHHINQKLRTHNRLEAVMHAIHRKLI
jgi:PAS domain S-box-containing protein